MINLFYFLSRYGGLLTFVVLEIAALYLIVRYNQTQREIWLNSSHHYSGVMLDRTARVREYATLSLMADSLARENARLYTRLYHQLAQAPPDAATDSIMAAFDILSARIIKNSVNLPNNNITLDRGRQDSITPGMGVMLPDGVLGIVQSTSERFCRVMSVLNTRTFISAVILRNGALGTLNWDGRDPGTLILEEVPKHLDVMEGDTVITSGHSAIFPAGIPVGVVRSYYVPSGSNSFHIEIRLFADLTRISRAYILRNRYWDEIRALEKEER
jgi:rod shape-determining protein MreC